MAADATATFLQQSTALQAAAAAVARVIALHGRQMLQWSGRDTALSSKLEQRRSSSPKTPWSNDLQQNH